MMAGMSTTFTPGSASNPTTEVELSISCKNLLDTDLFSKSDPMCVIHYKSVEDCGWKEIFRTETIDNTLNPTFAKKAVLTYQFEVKQELKFSVYDVDSGSTDLDDHDFLGSCTTTLGRLVSVGTSLLPLESDRQENVGQLNVSVEELGGSRDEITLQFGGSGLQRQDWLGWMYAFGQARSMFLEISKANEDGTYKLVHRTEVVRRSNDPRWKKFVVLCDDYDRDLLIVCYDWSARGAHAELGRFHVTMRQLSRGPGPETYFELHQYDTQNKRRIGSKNEGRIYLECYEARKVYSFLDYISSGTVLNCSFAIDFTASNGDPQTSESLHHISNYCLNDYEQALRAVGDIIQDYDSDNLYPVLGFGARIPPDGRVSHEFFVNMNPTNPYVQGIDGVIEAYKNCIRSIQLSGPTNFSPVIKHVTKFAQTYTDGSHYFILLIITDGVITDMEQTKKAIVNASTLPLSIIIVGVGRADFSLMEELDGDTRPLVSDGQKATRDIVQFVPFNKKYDVADSSVRTARLAKEVLAEIPDQIVSYMQSKGIEPGSFKKHNSIVTN